MHQGKLLLAVRPCRFIANRRYPIVAAPARRYISSSRRLLSAPQDPDDGRDSTSTGAAATDNIPPVNNVEGSARSDDQATKSTNKPSEKKEQSPYGSAARRAMRNVKQNKESNRPVAALPFWFFEKNLSLYFDEDPRAAQSMQQLMKITRSGSEEQTMAEGGEGDQPDSNGAQSESRYAITDALWEELRASVKAGMRLPPEKYAMEPSAKKSHLMLQYPGNDGVLFLDAVVKRLAWESKANLITLNAQDIAQLCSEYDLSDGGASSMVRSLGYEVYEPSGKESPEEEGEDFEEDEDESAMPRLAPKFITLQSPKGDANGKNRAPFKSILGLLGDRAEYTGNSKIEQRDWSPLIHKLFATPGRWAKLSDGPISTPESEAAAQNRDMIIQVQDYAAIRNTVDGTRFIGSLLGGIQTRRKEGFRVMLIGTTAQNISSPAPEIPPGAEEVGEQAYVKPLIVTPAMDSALISRTFAEDRKKRTLDINIRHLQDVLRTRLDLQSPPVDLGPFLHREWPLDPSIVKESGLAERYWLYSQVHWAATLALGCIEGDEMFGFEHIERGIELMLRTDRLKNGWLQEKSPKSKSRDSGNGERFLGSLRKTCNRYEKKLLNGVVDAKNIRTTFSDVHVPTETVDALKTLTSLSLIRPEAFTYGVLATDKIPGLLLYGPPGTGKTLLAKAVARESGATVLEVSGSDVYDMYVGEGEKNVKAIFTLAKKLSPCVVFIDEADAIFCSRAGGSHRSSHRELINQFLREWDGMNDFSAFIMVATNRPFDLDDAVLRRLPRRLVVDLPTEQDRHAILKIHLKDETLDPSVDLKELARRTPLYSGSDLKNLSVAAALACVREENEAAAQHQGEEPYQYPQRRTLTQAHFERGMEEISASINEDMSSLTAIKKFDEQYGDRKGRRKKSPGWGFMPARPEETGEEAARVRN